MKNKVSNRESLKKFAEDLSKSPLLDLTEKNQTSLQLIPAGTEVFFESFVLGKSFSFTSFFDPELHSSDGQIAFNGQKIIRKEKYDKGDLLPLIKLDELVPDKVTTTSLPLGQSLALDALKGKDDVFVSFANLYYQEKDKKSIAIAPLVFFKVEISEENDAYHLNLAYNSPLYNTPLFILLKQQYGIDFFSLENGFDCNDLLIEARKEISKFSFGIDDALYLVQADVMHELRLAYVVNYAPKMTSDNIFRSLEEDLPKEKVASFASKKDMPAYLCHGFDELSHYPVLKVEKLDPLNDSFVRSVVDQYILHKQTVLMVFKDKEAEKARRRELIEEYYDAFMPYKSITSPGTALFTMIEAVEKRQDYLLDSSLMMAKEEMRQRIDKEVELDSKIKALTIPTGEEDEEICRSYLFYRQNAKNIYSFSELTSYDFDNYLSDTDFLKYLDSSRIFQDECFTSHPFYGLNSAEDIKNYQETAAFLSLLAQDVLDFEKAIDNAQVKTSGWSDFNSIRDYDESVKLFEIYSKYDGFPLDYFDVDFTPELMADIAALEGFYRTEASITLSLDVLCRPQIWKEDFAQIMDDVKDRRREGDLKRRLKDIVKITPFRRSFKTLIVFVDKYQDNHQKIEHYRAELEPIFNSAADSLDGLLGIDKAAAFIKSYKRHMRLYDKLDFDNPFTKRIFHDQTFSDKYKNEYFLKMMEQRSVIEHDFDKYRSIFNEDKYDYIQASFSEIENRFNLKLKANKDDYEAYLMFSKKADASSKPLNKALDIIEAQGSSLKGFGDDYLTSLYQYLLAKSMKEGDITNLLSEESENLFGFYSQIAKGGDLLRMDTIKSFTAVRTQLIKRPSYKQTISALKEQYHSKRMLSANEALVIGGDVFSHLYPLQTVSLYEADYLADSLKFDLAIVDLREDNSLLDLFSSLTLAKKVLIIGKDFPLANQIRTLDLSLDEDLEAFKSLDNYPQIFKDEIKKAFKRQKIDIVQDKDVDVGVMIPYYFEKQGQKYALRLEDKDVSLAYKDSYALPMFLYKYYKIQTVYLYTLPFIVYEDLSVMSAYRNVKAVIDDMSGKQEDLSQLPYEQKKKAVFFKTLEEIASSFPYYQAGSEEFKDLAEAYMSRSLIEERPIVNISPLEIAAGIKTYLVRFTYLNRDLLISELAKVVGTNEKDVDFRLLFLRAETILLKQGIVEKNDDRLALKRR